MRSVVHISDLHFGRTDPVIVSALTAAIGAARPDVVVVSGDLTQRAKAHEFREAKAFLDTLPGAHIVVPGNHDVPLYNVLARWLTPLDNFRRYITGDLAPHYADGEIAVLGLNTARSLTFKNGRINREQVAHSCTRLGALAPDVVRIVVTHHPFALPDKTVAALVGRAAMAMDGFAQCHVDIVLSGHLHTTNTALSGTHYRDSKHSALLIQAGTATSSRRRGEANSFNILRIDSSRVNVERLSWDDASASFVVIGTETFARAAGGWNTIAASGEA